MQTARRRFHLRSDLSGAPTGRVTARGLPARTRRARAGRCAASEQPPHVSVKNSSSGPPPFPCTTSVGARSDRDNAFRRLTPVRAALLSPARRRGRRSRPFGRGSAPRPSRSRSAACSAPAASGRCLRLGARGIERKRPDLLRPDHDRYLSAGRAPGRDHAETRHVHDVGEPEGRPPWSCSWRSRPTAGCERRGPARRDGATRGPRPVCARTSGTTTRTRGPSCRGPEPTRTGCRGPELHRSCPGRPPAPGSVQSPSS